jgi:hypothetical protein
MRAATDRIAELGLAPHPEGGHYREVYRSTETIPGEVLPARFGGPRSFATAIDFLLGPGERSHLHRLRSDEIWLFAEGTGLVLHIIDKDGVHRPVKLGPGLAGGETRWAVVPAGAWFGAEPEPAEGWALVGCVLAPGFEFADFELGRREDLLGLFPHLSGIILGLTR